MFIINWQRLKMAKHLWINQTGQYIDFSLVAKIYIQNQDDKYQNNQVTHYNNI